LSTCSIRNTFSIVFLPTGIAAIVGTCTFGCEFFTAALADQILTAHLAVFPLPPIVGLIAAPVAVTVFLGVDGGVEHPTAAAADNRLKFRGRLDPELANLLKHTSHE